MTDTKTEALLWIDTETTAVNPSDGQLLEVGLMLTDMTGTTIEPIRAWTIRHDSISFTPRTEYAIYLHTRNGLIDESFTHGTDSTHAARTILETLTRYADQHRLHPAGTNVDFDLDWIESKLDLDTDMLDYHKLDLTPLRMLIRQTHPEPHTHQPTRHRVAECLQRDVSEYKTILDTITKALADDQREGSPEQ